MEAELAVVVIHDFSGKIDVSILHRQAISAAHIHRKQFLAELHLSVAGQVPARCEVPHVSARQAFESAGNHIRAAHHVARNHVLVLTVVEALTALSLRHRAFAAQ